MTSPVIKTGSSIGVASTSTQQPTNAAQASGLASLITATAAPAFTALGSPHASSPLSVVSPSALQRQAEKKVAPEIDTLVELGKAGGTTEVSWAQTEAYINEKIRTLLVDINDPKKRPSVRSDLCKLSRISSTYYCVLKEEIFNLLIRVIEEDPITQQSANGVLEVVIDLNSDLALSKAQMLTTPFQKKLARAFSASVELFLRHYNIKHFNAVMEEQKKALLATQKSFSNLNTHEIVDIEFANQVAIEASKRLTSDLTGFKDFFERLTHFATAIGKAYNKDLASFLLEFAQTFQGLDNKIKEKWFEALFALRDLVQKAPDTMDKVTIIQTMLATKKESYDWKFIYGALEILVEVVSQIQDVKMLEAVLFGQAATGINAAATESLGLAKETAALSAAAAQSIAPRLPGIVEFLEFNGYVTKALVATESDRKQDSAIQDKAKELCTQIIKKLSATSEGTAIVRMLEVYKQWINSKNDKGSSPLILAARKGDLEACKVLLKIGSNPLATDSDGFNAMHMAARSGNTEIVRLLLDQKQLLNARSKNGKTPLLLALSWCPQKETREQRATTCVVLMTAGADPLTDMWGENAMHYAVRDGQCHIVRVLIALHKQLINSKNAYGETPLILAAKKAERDDEVMCEILLAAGADPYATNSQGLNAIQLAQMSLGEWKGAIVRLLSKYNPLTTKEDDSSAMHWAALFGQTEILRLLIANKQPIDSKNKRGETPLMHAALGGYLDACEILLKAGANPNTKNGEGRNAMQCAWKAEIVKLLSAHMKQLDSKQMASASPVETAAVEEEPISDFHTAITIGDIESVEKYISQNKKLANTKDLDEIPLILAAKAGHLKICEILIKDGADPLAKDWKGRNAMHWAVSENNIEIVRLLSVHKQLIDSKNNAGETPLSSAAQRGYLEVCKLLLNAGADPLATADEGRWNAMHYAASNGRTEIVRLLLAYKPLIDSKDEDGKTPLILAAFTNRLETFQILLQASADSLATEGGGWNAMHYAAKNGNTEMVRMLSVFTQLIDSKNGIHQTPFMLAAQQGRLGVCEVLLKAEANPLATDMDHWNAMHYAASKGNVDTVRMLSGHKQLIDVINNKGRTPLMEAARVPNDFDSYKQECYVKVCEILVKAGADLFAKDVEGWNVMHFVAKGGNTEMVKKLSCHKDLINSANYFGRTPLILASEEGDLEVCAILLKAGANPSAADQDGLNAIHWATNAGETKVVKLLSAHMKQIDSKK